MDNIRCVQVPTVLRKEKKKQVKDELDRIKQAEKKKRRLEKALATSAAIRSELEKKKQKKKEEQQRLDEEGAAIAEAVALHVLCDDSDQCQIVLNNDHGINCNKWDHAANIGLVMGGLRAGPAYQGFTKHSLERMGWISDVHGSACKWNDRGIGLSLTSGFIGRDFQAPIFEERGRGGEVSAGLIAAQAVSSIQIAEDLRNKINLYKENYIVLMGICATKPLMCI